MDSNCNFVEHGITMHISESVFKVLGRKNVMKRLELGTSRAVALSSLSVLSKLIPGQITSLETGAGLCLAGLQWRKYLSSDVKVVINPTMGLKEHVETTLSEQNIAGDVQIMEGCSNVVMHSKKFMFVYAEVYGPSVTYLDAALRSVNHNGLLCVTSTDTAILQNKSPGTARRLYCSNAWKTEYYKEMGARIVIGNIARAAARWEKGIRVELCMVLEHGITVVCRVLKGSKHGERSIHCLQQLAHCQLCQSRQFIPESLYIKDKYSKLCLCDCNSDSLAAPILLLGPMWSGSIFNKTFLCNILFELKKFNLASSDRKVFELMIVESACCQSQESEDDVNETIKGSAGVNGTNDSARESEPAEKRRKLEVESDHNSKDAQIVLQKGGTGNNAINTLPCASAEIYLDNSNPPPFYFDFQFHSIKGGNPPSLNSVIAKLREKGYRASKTHFGPRCVRTSAALKVFKDTLQLIWNETCKK